MNLKTLQCLISVAGLPVFSSMGEPLTPVTQRNAALPPPAAGGGDSQVPILTPDGRYVVFASTANNLVTNDAGSAFLTPGIPKMNVFRRDRLAGTTTLVSVNAAGTGGGSDDSLPTAVSDNGRYVLFESAAADLANFDTNGVTDIFLRDVWSNVTHLVSATTNGFAGNNLSRGSTMTPEGRHVAFTSLATNLVAGDSNGIPDVFVRDLETGVTLLATPGSRGAADYDPIGSESPDLSADGRYLAFYSVATNVVPGVTNLGEVYVRDLVAGSTTWVSAPAHSVYGATATSFSHVLAAAGGFLAYVACSNHPAYSSSRGGTVLRYQLLSGVTDVVATNAYVPPVNPEDYHDLAMTSNGRFISFVAQAGSSPGSGSSIRRWDAVSGTSQLVSSNWSGGVTGSAFCAHPVMDATGRFVAYISNAGNLVTNSLRGDFQVFLTDVDLGDTVLVNAGTNGVGTGVGPRSVPQLSSNGTLVAFESASPELADHDSNHATDIFARDRTFGTNELISLRAETLPGSTPNGPASFDSYSASRDGQRAVFASEARDLVALDTNGFRDVFVRDLFGGSNVLVSVNTNGGVANGTSSEPAISPDGRYVVFTSDANDLVAGDTNKVADVFLRDLELGRTWAVSITPDGIGFGNGASGSASVGTGGRFILFRSGASNLVAGPPPTSSTWRWLQRDRDAGQTYALNSVAGGAASATPEGRFVALADASTGSSQIYVWDGVAAARISTNTAISGIIDLALSPDATKVAYFTASQFGFVDRSAGTNGTIAAGYYSGSRTGLRFSADGRFLTYAAAEISTLSPPNRVFRYDFQTMTLTLVSHLAGWDAPASGNADSPDISADGRFIAYRSSATNLLAVAQTNQGPHIFLHDAQTGVNRLLSVSRDTGVPANNRSRAPVFSPDGRTLFFHSWAQDLIAADFNQTGDVVALPLLYITITPTASAGSGPTLSWPNRPGETYQVQFKDNPDAATWQTVPGSIAIVGNRATLTDPAPGPGNRIYRVLAQPLSLP